MTDDIAPDITALLGRWRDGDQEAGNALFDAIYPLLREIARKQLHGQQDLTLDPTDLVHETYARLCRNASIDFQDRGHFFAVAARAARHFVVDYVRSRDADKRGNGLPFVDLENVADEVSDNRIDLGVDWLAVHAALNELERKDSHSARVVELKFFSGLTTEEIADAVGVSRASVVREWRFARAWLAGRLRKGS
ncbi:MAG TPA: ECF-type sigma factor [Tahibacter sp.]|jgi:RNA polymerase sigma factor (TIGR02999 family)|nr:ECF-type sigma factor [Tahibacter sp.]